MHKSFIHSLLITIIICLTIGPLETGAQPNRSIQSIDNYEEDYEVNDERNKEAEADANFDQIMLPQNAAKGSLNKFADDKLDIAEIQQSITKEKKLDYSHDSIVEITLKTFERIRDTINRIQKISSYMSGPAVVLGSSEFSGKAIKGALLLKLKLQATLGRPGKWKTVPLIGDNVILVKATANGKQIPISRRNAYHVWMTKKTGEVTIFIDLMIPSHGPRGSIEYEFLAARTPVTKFSCYFPVQGLEPRLSTAIQSKALNYNNGTLYTAMLRPTTRIHLVGFKEMGIVDSQAAKVYSDSMNLLSIDEGHLELFTVVRYTILYSGTKKFKISIPADMKIVSADGMGAFKYTLREEDNGTLLLGETAFPIRNNYEISLRLKRKMEKDGEAFKVPLPHCRDVEREYGWLGVEVPGKLQLEEKKRENIQNADIRQLPEEIVRSAVSPILKAYRYHSPDADVELLTHRLPEIEPTSGSIDNIQGFTKITSEGKMITDLRITLRNRMRHSLTLKLPQDSKVSSSMLLGQPLTLSKDKYGNIILPLKRSEGGDELIPFTISVIIEKELKSFGFFGFPCLELPVLNLPISSFSWTLYLPKRNKYSKLKSDIDLQKYVGQVSWYKPYDLYDYYNQINTIDTGASNINLSSTGAMPVRFKIPKDGVKMRYTRYWVEKDEQIELSFSYIRSWLYIPIWIIFFLSIVTSMLLISFQWKSKGNTFIDKWFSRLEEILKLDLKVKGPGIGFVILVIAIILNYFIIGTETIYSGIFAGIIVIAIHRKVYLSIYTQVMDLWKQYSQRKRDRKTRSIKQRLKSVSLALCFVVFGIIFLVSFVDLLYLLFK